MNHMAEQMQSNTPDPAVALDSLETVSIFLADAFDTGHPAYIAWALGVVARAAGLAELAAAVGVNRGELESAMGKGELSLDMTLAIMKVIDLHLPPRTTAVQAA
jgi:probable addiction module antidote protein